MRKQILIITSLMLCYLQGHSQSSGLPKDRGNGESPRADTRRIPSPATSVRTFTYDAAGNRILMETPTRNAQASPGRNQPRDGQAVLRRKLHLGWSDYLFGPITECPPVYPSIWMMSINLTPSMINFIALHQ